MAQTKLRRALIISQEIFDIAGMEKRIGNQQDIKQIESVLDLYGFKTTTYKDKKKQEILNILTCSTLEDYSNVDCIVVIVLTHGNNGGVLFARDRKFYTKDVWGPFRDCEALKDIPKVFIFQACRGGNEERSFSSHSPTEEKQNNFSVQIVPVLPHTPGFLLAHSTIEDYVSIRNHATGTVFIQTLCNELVASYNKTGEVANFISLLTEVNNKVAISAKGKDGSQTSTFTSFLQQPLNLKTNKTLETKNSTPSISQDSFDATGECVKSAYDDKGTRLLLILYTEKFEKEVQKLERVLNPQQFTVKIILVNNMDIINSLSKKYNFENTCSLTLIVLAGISEDNYTEYREIIYVSFSKAQIPITDIWSQFTASRCHQLRGKPKLFFFCDLLDREDSGEKNTVTSASNTESVNNHSDFLWTYCYGTKMFEELSLALSSSREEITQSLTSAMNEAEESTSSTGSKISYFESTLKLKFYFHSIDQQKTEGKLLPQLNVASVGPMEPVASSSKSDTISVKAFAKGTQYSMVQEERDKSLIEAAQNGLVEMMRILISSGANINAKDEYNNTPLLLAAWKNQALAAKLLIEAGADLDTQNKFKNNALTWAADNNRTEICKMLVDAGADVNMRNAHGYSALTLAAYKNNIEVVKMLLEKRAQVNIVDNVGETPLSQAAKNANANVAKLLLENGAQVNIARNDGEIPLHVAAGYGHIELAKTLVSYGANINVKAKDGRTPLGVALSVSQFEVVNYLRSIGATE